jgi:hypothetical protein
MIQVFSDFLLNSTFVCILKCAGFILKTFLLFILTSYYLQEKTNRRGLVLIAAILGTAAISDIHYFITTIPTFFGAQSDPTILLLSKRITWIANIFFHLGIILLLEYLVRENSLLSHIISLIRGITAGCIMAIFLAIIFISPSESTRCDLFAGQAIYIYALILSIQTLIRVVRSLINTQVPRLLRHQIKILIFWLIGPHLLLKFVVYDPRVLRYLPGVYENALNVCSSLFITGALYFCATRLIRLRFLNIKKHVLTPTSFDFITDFKKTLSQLGHASSITELKHISQQFFKDAFKISDSAVKLSVCNEDFGDETDNRTQLLVATIMHSTTLDNDNPLYTVFHQTKVILRDEIEFSAFHEDAAIYNNIMLFLNQINADIFLPIFDKNVLIGFIIVEQHITPNQFFTNTMRDEMAIFTEYLSSTINLLRNRNLDTLLIREKQLDEEVYHQNREIAQYKESLRHFIKLSSENKIGILFYRNNRFTFGNQAAQEFICHDPNIHHGHPLTQVLKRVAIDVERYKTQQTAATRTDDDRHLMISALPSIENQSVIITLSYPEIADIIKLQATLLRNPSHWDYILYLETTESGRLINQLIPGSGEFLLNFKIELFDIALNRKATLLCAPTDDTQSLIEILHTISLRKKLHTIALKDPETHLAYGIQLFGINQLLSSHKNPPPLLETLNKTGTLYIENIHLLSLETQNHLAEFIRYGAFRPLRAKQRTVSDVRIIASSDTDLAHLTEEGLFSAPLFNELKRASITMPSLTNLPPQEFNDLVTGLTSQILKVKHLERILHLDDKEKMTLYERQPRSIQELRKKLYAQLVSKSAQHNIEGAIAALPTQQTLEPEVSRAIMLGKKALKDNELMDALWEKFKSHTKIATLLGVNRSSVNRRFKHRTPS